MGAVLSCRRGCVSISYRGRLLPVVIIVFVTFCTETNNQHELLSDLHSDNKNTTTTAITAESTISQFKTTPAIVFIRSSPTY